MAVRVHRAFLNPKEGMAVCQTRVEKDRGDEFCHANIQLTDCNRGITLDFDFYESDDKDRNIDYGDRANALKKCDKLIAMITKFREELKQI